MEMHHSFSPLCVKWGHVPLNRLWYSLVVVRQEFVSGTVGTNPLSGQFAACSVLQWV